MTLEVQTARINYRGEGWLDITRAQKMAPATAGGHLGIGLAFAPSSRLLRFYLERKRESGLTDKEWLAYVEQYTDEMRSSYKRNRAPWETLLSMPKAVLVCFCKDPTRCHRGILAQWILPKLGAKYMGEIS